MGSVAMFIGLGPMGQLIIGQLAEWLDPQTAILIIGGIGLVTVAASSIAFPIFRNGRATEVDREQRRAQARELLGLSDEEITDLEETGIIGYEPLVREV